MKFISGSLCFALLVLSASSQSDSKERNCVSLKDCPSAVRLLSNADPHTKLAALSFIHSELFCHDWDGLNPMIACPFGEFTIPDKYLPQKGKRDQMKEKLLDVCGNMVSNRMNRSGNKTELSEYPWLARLQFHVKSSNEKYFGCGGVLISDQHVLTSASCVEDDIVKKLVAVRLGEYDAETEKDCSLTVSSSVMVHCNKPVIDVGVEQIFIHKEFDPIEPNFYLNVHHKTSDLAIVKLERKVEFSDELQPICLPQHPEASGQKYEVAGWSTSSTFKGNSLRRKLRAELSRVSIDQCKVDPDKMNKDDFICAKSQRLDGKGSPCVSDAGGPLMAHERNEKGEIIPKMAVLGVLADDRSCSVQEFQNYDGTIWYTKVHKYMPWIENTIFSS